MLAEFRISIDTDEEAGGSRDASAPVLLRGAFDLGVKAGNARGERFRRSAGRAVEQGKSTLDERRGSTLEGDTRIGWSASFHDDV